MINLEKLDDDFIEECELLLKENHDCSGHFDAPLEIDWLEYKKLNESFMAFTLRSETGELEGVLFFAIAKYPHHKNILMAQQITFYIKPKHRRFSYVMMQESEHWLRDVGVDIVVQSARFGTSFCHTLEIRGYQKTDVVYIKKITEKMSFKEVV